MLALSPYLLLYQVITSFRRRSCHPFSHRFIPTPSLYYLPESIGALYHCISIRMWFYNQFFTLILRPFTPYTTFRGNKRHYLPFWTLFILIYIFYNLILTSKI
jgi:hypothetical protein